MEKDLINLDYQFTHKITSYAKVVEDNIENLDPATKDLILKEALSIIKHNDEEDAELYINVYMTASSLFSEEK